MAATCINQLVITCGAGLAAFLGLPASLSQLPQNPVAGDLYQPVAEPPKRSDSDHRATSSVQVVKPMAAETNDEKSPAPAPLLTMPSDIVALQKPTQSAEENTVEPAAVLPAILNQTTTQSPALPTPLPAKENTRQLPVEEKAIPSFRPTIGTANHITVPSVGIDIAVQPGEYDAVTSTWRVDDSSAFIADTTVPVNDSNGTSLIYGHARWGIFGTLPDLQEGAEAIVATAEGPRFVYVFESMGEVSPSDVSILTAEGNPKLILQTCSGWFDQYRMLATFRLKEVLRD